MSRTQPVIQVLYRTVKTDARESQWKRQAVDISLLGSPTWANVVVLTSAWDYVCWSNVAHTRTDILFGIRAVADLHSQNGFFDKLFWCTIFFSIDRQWDENQKFESFFKTLNSVCFGNRIFFEIFHFRYILCFCLLKRRLRISFAGVHSCRMIANAYCEQNRCQCKNSFVRIGLWACAPRADDFGDECFTDLQCAHLHEHASCVVSNYPQQKKKRRSCTASFTSHLSEQNLQRAKCACESTYVLGVCNNQKVCLPSKHLLLCLAAHFLKCHVHANVNRMLFFR